MKLDTAMEDRTRVLQTVAAAAGIAFALDLLLLRLQRPVGAGEIIARLVVYPITVLFYLAIGWWLGRRAWPKRGTALTRSLIRRRIASKKLIFICDRPDARRNLLRRIWEVVGFSAGLVLFGLAIIRFFELNALVSGPLLFILIIGTLWGAFAIIPYWQLSRLGLRTIDPVRWTIIPIGRRYAERARLSNGFFVVIGAGAVFNILIRSGASGLDAVAESLTLVLQTVVSILVIATAAVAFYHRTEFALSHKLELEAIEMGVRDGRGMSDGDFLPRLPPPKPKTPPT